MKRLASAAALLGLVAIGTAAAPKPANAWWAHGGWCCSVGVYVPPVVIAPPVVVAPAPVYEAPAYYGPAPAYYAPPQRVWIPAHWHNGYWIRGHWA
jgi:hypothetical protein